MPESDKTHKDAFRVAVRAALTGQIDERIGLAWTVYGEQIAAVPTPAVSAELRGQVIAALKEMDREPMSYRRKADLLLERLAQHAIALSLRPNSGGSQTTSPEDEPAVPEQAQPRWRDRRGDQWQWEDIDKGLVRCQSEIADVDWVRHHYGPLTEVIEAPGGGS